LGISDGGELRAATWKLWTQGGSERSEMYIACRPLGIQFRRIVNLAPRSSVIGHVGFRLTEQVLDGRFGTAAPYRNINALTREELINLGNLTMNAILRVTNQLDGSYRDFPVMKSVQGRAKEFESRTKPSN